MKQHAIGIDLGTTNTMAARIGVESHSQVLPMRDGEILIPSAVLFADERTIVGREAQLRGRAHPERFAACAKRSIGQPYYEHPIAGEWIPPEVIQACILRQLRTEHASIADPGARIVIAVPAHFNETQRHITSMAAEMAGLKLLDLVNEPIAAALAFAEDAPAFAISQDHAPNYYLVFDLGGYTFEATVLAIRPGEMQMVATDHDLFLGGHDWDVRVADLLAEPSVRDHKVDPRADPRQLEKFMQRAAQVKHSLSERSQASISLHDHHGQSEICKLTRDQFEAATADLLARALQLCDRLLQGADLKWSGLRQVLLVGGATRMPMIQRMLSQRLGRDVDARVAPEEVVARGAAIYASQVLNHDRRPPALQVASMSTHSLGVEGVDQDTGHRTNKVLIPKGTPLPASVTREFPSQGSDQHSIVFNVLEGENSDPGKCRRIGQVILGDLPTDVSGEWPVDVTYEYSQSGQLSVMARVRYTDRIVRLTTVRSAGVSQAHLDKWTDVVAVQAGFDAYRQVRGWEKSSEAVPAVVVAGLPKAEVAPTGQAIDGNDAAGEAEGVRSFLRRLMPFLFRPPLNT